MGFSLKRFGNVAAKVLIGNDAANSVLGVVGLGDDQLAAAEQWEWQKKAADYKYAQDLNMWNLVNAYNDPASQAERLERAGFNKNLVYGGGNVTGNTSGSGPVYSNIDPGYTDRSIQRKQLAMALKEHQQRITNQAIENDLARQRLFLAERDADRSDALVKAQIGALKSNLGLRSEEIGLNEGMRRDSFAWHKYEDAHKVWEARRTYALRNPSLNRNEQAFQRFIGREPMYMDYLE